MGSPAPPLRRRRSDPATRISSLVHFTSADGVAMALTMRGLPVCIRRSYQIPVKSQDRSVGQALSSHELPGHHHLHHLGGAVTDLEPDDITHALLEGQLVRVAVVAVKEQALMNRIDGQPRRPPLGHGRFLRVALAMI